MLTSRPRGALGRVRLQFALEALSINLTTRIYIFKWREGVAFKFHTTQLCLDDRCKRPLLDVAEHADALLDGVPYT